MEADRALSMPSEACLRAMASRDRRFDGHFFTAVKTTGIYCRPICPARTPLARNVRFFPSAAAAESAGFRPCRRCRPEAAPGTPAWQGTSATASRALRLIQEGALDRDGLEEFAERLGVGSRHLRRLLLEHAGATPLQLALTRRLHFARRLLDETTLPISAIGPAAGFRSERRFRAAFREAFGIAPTQLRSRPRRAGTRGSTAPRSSTAPPAAAAPRPSAGFRAAPRTAPRVADDEASGSLRLTLAWRPPLPFPPLLAFLAARAIPGCESVTETAWSTTMRIGRDEGIVSARIEPPRDGEEPRRSGAARAKVRGAARVTRQGGIVRLHVPAELAAHAMEIASRVRRLLDLDADPLAIAARLKADARLSPLVRKRPGLRSPGAWDPFPCAIRIVLGQQISVVAATTLAGRVVRAFGEPLRPPGSGSRRSPAGTARAASSADSHDGALAERLVFPSAARLADAPFERCGIPARRAATLRALSVEIAEGRLVLQAGGGQDLEERLLAVPGIGPWTASAIAMRACGDPDAFPAGDLALARILGGESSAHDAAEAWRPFRAYAAMHLWTEAAS